MQSLNGLRWRRIRDRKRRRCIGDWRGGGYKRCTMVLLRHPCAGDNTDHFHLSTPLLLYAKRLARSLIEFTGCRQTVFRLIVANGTARLRSQQPVDGAVV